MMQKAEVSLHKQYVVVVITNSVRKVDVVQVLWDLFLRMQTTHKATAI